MKNTFFSPTLEFTAQDVTNYLNMLNEWYVQMILHLIIILNSFFLLKGIKFYNEDTGVE